MPSLTISAPWWFPIMWCVRVNSQQQRRRQKFHREDFIVHFIFIRLINLNQRHIFRNIMWLFLLTGNLLYTQYNRSWTFRYIVFLRHKCILYFYNYTYLWRAKRLISHVYSKLKWWVQARHFSFSIRRQTFNPGQFLLLLPCTM